MLSRTIASSANTAMTETETVRTDTITHAEKGLGSSCINGVITRTPPHDECSKECSGQKKKDPQKAYDPGKLKRR